MSENSRLEKLRAFLNSNPKDSFTRYAVAMEIINGGDIEGGLAEFNTLLQNDPDYTPAYQMAGQTLLKQNRIDEGRAMLEKGIACAGRTGNAHARSEMEGMLLTLPD